MDRAIRSIRECDVALMVIDATEAINGISDQDKKIASIITDAGKGMVIAINKWDLIEDKKSNTINKFEENGKLYRVDSEGNHIYELSSPNDKIYEDADGNEIIITDNMQFYINHLNYATAKISDDFEDSIQKFVDMFAESNNKSAKRFYKYLSSDNITEDNLKTTMEDRTDYSEEVNKQNNSAMVNKNRELSKSINLD